jgi:hypothetical protein
MVQGALGCMKNADYEKNSKLRHCAKCVYYLSKNMTHTNNLKNNVLVHSHRPSK